MLVLSALPLRSAFEIDAKVVSLHVKGRRAITLCMEKLCDTFVNHSLVFHFQLFFFIFFGSAPQ